MQIVLALLHTRIVKFGLVGGLVALIGGGILYTLVDILSIEKNAAYFVQAVISLQLNFNLNDRFTWADRRGQNGRYWNRWVKFHIVRILSAILSQILFALLTVLGVYYMLAYAVCIVFATGFNYFTSNRFVFSLTKHRLV
jgi:putative flippase GtrA